MPRFSKSRRTALAGSAALVLGAGVAAGVYSTARYLGSIVGSALLGALLSGDAAGFPALFAVVLIAGVASVAACLGLNDRPRPAAA